MTIPIYSIYVCCGYLYLYLLPIYPSCCATVVCHRKGKLCLGDLAVFTGKVSAPGACRPTVNSLSESHESTLTPDLYPSFSSSIPSLRSADLSHHWGHRQSLLPIILSALSCRADSDQSGTGKLWWQLHGWECAWVSMDGPFLNVIHSNFQQ